MAKMNPRGQVGSTLTFMGSLFYLYVFFSWYNGGATGGAWVAASQFLGPLFVALALFGAVNLLFMSISSMIGMTIKDMKMGIMLLWRFISMSAVSFIILTGGTQLFMWSLAAFIITFVGAMISTEM